MSLWKSKKLVKATTESEKMEIVGSGVQELNLETKEPKRKNPKLFGRQRWSDKEISEALEEIHSSREQEAEIQAISSMVKIFSEKFTNAILDSLKNLEEGKRAESGGSS